MADRRIDIDIVANDKASAVFKQIGTNMSNISSNAVGALSKLDSGLQRYNNAMSGLYRTTQIAFAGAGYFVYKFTRDSINQFADFERQHAKTMGAIATNYDKSAASQQKFIADQKKLKEQALQIGTFGADKKGSLYNPTEVSSTQTALVKAGVSASDIANTNITSSIVKFAGGNDLGLETATDYAVNIGQIYGIKSKDYGSMLDKITKAADISTIDVPDIFESLKYTGPIASSLGRSLDETLGLISVLGNAGLKGSMAGTGIQALFTRMLSPVGMSEKAMQTAPSDHVKDVLQSFVDSTTDASGKFKDMPTVTNLLDQAMEGLNDKEQAWFAHKLFGLYQMKAAFSLKNTGGDVLQNVINTITNQSAGANEKKWGIMLESAYGKQEKLKNAFAGMQMDVGYRLLPFSAAVMDELYQVFAEKGNYHIDYKAIKSGLGQTGELITQQYGQQIGDLVVKLGNMGIDTSRVGAAMMPMIGGFGLGYAKLLGGDVPGAIAAFSSGISETSDKVKNLPPELQSFAKQVKNATTVLLALAGINFAARVLESVTGLAKFIDKITKIGGASTTSAANRISTMSVYGDIVNVYGKNVGKGTGTGKGGKSSGSTVLLDENGNPKTGVNTGGAKGPITGYYKDGTPKIQGYNKNGTPSKRGGASVETPTETTGKSKGFLSGKMGKALGAYSIFEMLGVNDWLLDATPAKNGTAARSVIDTGRTALDWGLTGSFIDDILFHGSVKGAIKGAFAGQAPKIGTTFAEVLRGGLTAGGLTSSIALATAGIGAGIAVGYDQYQKSKKLQENMDKAKENAENGRKTYVTNDGEVVSMPSDAEIKTKKEANKYNYGGGTDQTYLTVATPQKPGGNRLQDWNSEAWAKYDAEMENYNQAMARIDSIDQTKRNRFSTAQSIYNARTGNNLTWGDYKATEGAWKKILPDSTMQIGSSFVGQLGGLTSKIAASQSAFDELSKVKIDANGNVDQASLRTALTNIANDSSTLASKLTELAGNSAKLGQQAEMNSKSSWLLNMSNWGSKSNTVKQQLNGTPKTGNLWTDALNSAKVVGGANGTGLDLPTLLNQYNALGKVNGQGNVGMSTILSKLDQTSSTNNTALGKLDAINSSIQSQHVTVNVPAPNVIVNVDKNGGVTKQTTGSYVTTGNKGSNGGLLPDLFKLGKARFAP